MRVGTQGLFRPYLKTFVAPFHPAQLTAPGLACVAWRFWLGVLSNKGGQGQRNREEIGAGATLFFSRLCRSFSREFCGFATRAPGSTNRQATPGSPRMVFFVNVTINYQVVAVIIAEMTFNLYIYFVILFFICTVLDSFNCRL